MEKKGETISSSSEGVVVENKPKYEAEWEELLPTLEREIGWDGQELFNYRGFWYHDLVLRRVLSIQKHFKAKETDIIVASTPKSGTTWLNALTFAISTRNIFGIDQSPLLTSNPHSLVPSLEFGADTEPDNPNHPCKSGPRIFSTHLAYEILPQSILDSDCPIIYICRNPLDLFISYRMFILENKFYKDGASGMDEAFDLFCRGICSFGPVWKHVLGYWNARNKDSRKVLFLRYEELQENIHLNVKKIAEFIGLPFTPEEEKRGVVEQISHLCSFESLSNLNVNKTGVAIVDSLGLTVKYSSYFRMGKVGDSTCFLTPAMVERMKKIVEIKFKDSGLSFEF